MAPEADLIRAIERERLRALVQVGMEVERRLHADNFQLINPVAARFQGSILR